ncbi:MAG: pyrroline-5-carboxylate reductase [Arenicellales bacterium]
MSDSNIAFIGGGNMARSLIGGLVAAGTPSRTISVSDPQAELRNNLQEDFGINVHADNISAATGARVIVLAVKPQVLQEVVAPLGTLVSEHQALLVSIAAGITAPSIERWAGGQPALVRVMPNTPALVGAGISALYANENVDEDQRKLAETIMSAVGKTVWIEDESLMDTVTAVSGSGPAYFFYVMQGINDAAVNNGLDAETARLLTLETALGAARLALESAEEPGTLQKRVTSPGGTTEAAINVLDSSGVSDAFQNAVSAACARGGELAKLLDKD